MPKFKRGKIHIDRVPIPGIQGSLGLCAAPGSGYLWGSGRDNDDERGAEADLRFIHQWGADGVITLLERMELMMVHAPDMGEMVEAEGMWWRHLPIRDMSTPTPAWETLWDQQAPELHRRLIDGETIVLHCLAGLGRTGLIAARLLIEFGVKPRDAIATVREIRPGTIQTWRQKWYVQRRKPIPELVEQASQGN